MGQNIKDKREARLSRSIRGRGGKEKEKHKTKHKKIEERGNKKDEGEEEYNDEERVRSLAS